MIYPHIYLFLLFQGATLTNGNEDHIEEGVESSEDEETEKLKMNR